MPEPRRRRGRGRVPRLEDFPPNVQAAYRSFRLHYTRLALEQGEPIPGAHLFTGPPESLLPPMSEEEEEEESQSHIPVQVVAPASSKKQNTSNKDVTHQQQLLKEQHAFADHYFGVIDLILRTESMKAVDNDDHSHRRCVMVARERADAVRSKINKKKQLTKEQEQIIEAIQQHSLKKDEGFNADKEGGGGGGDLLATIDKLLAKVLSETEGHSLVLMAKLSVF